MPHPPLKKLILLGATGSIGNSTLSVLRQFPQVAMLSGFSYHHAFDKAKEIQAEFTVPAVCSTNPNPSVEEIQYWKSRGVFFCQSTEELLETNFDLLLSAVVGSVGIRAALKAAQKGKTILLANKEALVMAGRFLMKTAQENQAQILPIDSEHNSLFRLLQKTTDVEQIILTASGGPFREKSLLEIQQASIEQVLQHPTWEMGHKITVDSAGMINKALEIMEAHFLFGFPYEKIQAVIHPQSFVHGLLQHKDGSFSFHAGEADMRLPIAYCLFFPKKTPAFMSPLLPAQIPTLEFFAIDKEKFPGFFLGVQAGKKGGAMPAVFNAANEAAVACFLKKKIAFVDIPKFIEKTLEAAEVKFKGHSLEEIFEADVFARRYVEECLQ